MRFVGAMLAGLVVFSPCQAASINQSLPKDVAHFLDRREQCDHWTGEEPYDAARRREIEAAIRDLRCVTIERDARTLRKRYVRSKAILALLAE